MGQFRMTFYENMLFIDLTRVEIDPDILLSYGLLNITKKVNTEIKNLEASESLLV
jgi:hypothetical protein